MFWHFTVGLQNLVASFNTLDTNELTTRSTDEGFGFLSRLAAPRTANGGSLAQISEHFVDFG